MEGKRLLTAIISPLAPASLGWPTTALYPWSKKIYLFHEEHSKKTMKATDLEMIEMMFEQDISNIYMCYGRVVNHG